ncbi:HMA2 domain-containing protein [Bacillus sp. S/N-304-OC-R1]|uniref:HMA2 domain-containing protein n=1 Tax=Bacillus sp. S/N-304-OC-R1 TaxID=2758034 RepID=UPI001C8ED472|nr:metal ABC transporter ATPase [Bacillus sp. S/N-304-OC-R1]MBY0123764.1 metal ABC transporter ATPase [Bacillus sp. S/N-304-OC-R1]
MLNKVKELQLFNRMNKILKKHSIEVIHNIPGRIRLRSVFWKSNTELVNKLIKHFENDPAIYSISYTAETGSLLITYDSSPIDHMKQLEAWMEQIEWLSQKVR